MDNIQLWINGYLDDELTDHEREQLARALETDPMALDELVFDSFIHSQLLDWMDRQGVQDRVTSVENAAGESGRRRDARAGQLGDRMVSRLSPASAAFRDENISKRSRRWSPAILAASLLVAASASIAAYIFATRPVIVAQLTQATQSQWGEPHATITVGSLLEDGQELKLDKGSALITLSSGAQLLLEAPTALRLDSAMQVHLHHGRIAARVPTTARGVTVTSSLARFVDLGTAFTLKLADKESFELHVFEGLVELQLDERFGDAVHQPLRVAEVRAV
jgi:hypothetical protein